MVNNQALGAAQMHAHQAGLLANQIAPRGMAWSTESAYTQKVAQAIEQLARAVYFLAEGVKEHPGDSQELPS